MSNKVWVDPEQGWRYGFPKLWDKTQHATLVEFLEANGWPKDKQAEFNYVRMWEANENEPESTEVPPKREGKRLHRR